VKLANPPVKNSGSVKLSGQSGLAWKMMLHPTTTQCGLRPKTKRTLELKNLFDQDDQVLNGIYLYGRSDGITAPKSEAITPSTRS
jgi:hypothetical protein